jgi:hypothetical protein
VRKPHRVACAVAFALVVIGIVGVIGGCGLPQSKEPFQDPFFEEDKPNGLMSGDMDKDETEWRKQLHHETKKATQNDATESDPPQSDPLLKDDPPKAPEQYGKVANGDAPPKDQVASAKKSDPYAVVDDDPETDEKDQAPPTFWQTVGRAGFAVFTVIMTLGMMAAPYLMMM